MTDFKDNILDFKKKMIEKLKKNPETKLQAEEQEYIRKITDFADAIDLAIEKAYLDEEVQAIDVLGVMAHRTGKFMSYFDGKEKAYFIIDQIVKEEAELLPKSKPVEEKN